MYLWDIVSKETFHNGLLISTWPLLFSSQYILMTLVLRSSWAIASRWVGHEEANSGAQKKGQKERVERRNRFMMLNLHLKQFCLLSGQILHLVVTIGIATFSLWSLSSISNHKTAPSRGQRQTFITIVPKPTERDLAQRSPPRSWCCTNRVIDSPCPAELAVQETRQT